MHRVTEATGDVASRVITGLLHAPNVRCRSAWSRAQLDTKVVVPDLFVVRLSGGRSAGWCRRLGACRRRVRRGVGRDPVIGGPGSPHVEQDQHKGLHRQSLRGSRSPVPISRRPHPRRLNQRRNQPITTEFATEEALGVASFPPVRAPSWGCAGAFLGLRCAVADRAASGL
jgi:hypothetical protein